MLIVCFISDVEAPSRSPAAEGQGAEGQGADVVDDGMHPTLVADHQDSRLEAQPSLDLVDVKVPPAEDTSVVAGIK